MAVYNSLADGNAQKGLTVGDLVKTPKGGTWQILDSGIYSGMTSDQLKAAGVNYNPTNGYYSKLYTGGDEDTIKTVGDYTSYGKYQDTSMLDKWKDAYIQSQVAKLQSAYNKNLANLTKTYRDNYTNYYNQIGSTKNDYAKNIQDLYDNTYLNNAMALQQAANRGMTSAAQGVAMGTSGLMSASQKASQLTSDRDTLISSIQSQLNRLTENYNVDKDLLEANFSADKIAAMSDAELQYINSALDIENNNNNTYNSWAQIGMQNKYNSGEAEKERQWNEKMSDKEFERQKELMALEAQYNRSYGGGGYYSYGGNGYNKSSGNSGTNVSKALQDYYNSVAGGLGETARQSFLNWLYSNPNASVSSAKSFLNTLTNPTGVVNQAANNAMNIAKNSSKKSSNKKSSSGTSTFDKFIGDMSDMVRGVTSPIVNLLKSSSKAGGTSAWY